MKRLQETRRLNGNIELLGRQITYLQEAIRDTRDASLRGERIRNDGERFLLMLESVKVTGANTKALHNEPMSYTRTPSTLTVEFEGSPAAVAQIAAFLAGRMR